MLKINLRRLKLAVNGIPLVCYTILQSKQMNWRNSNWKYCRILNCLLSPIKASLKFLLAVLFNTGDLNYTFPQWTLVVSV